MCLVQESFIAYMHTQITFLLICHVPTSPALQDEIFHIPQVQSYCNHNYSHWDPMIPSSRAGGLVKNANFTIKPEAIR